MGTRREAGGARVLGELCADIPLRTSLLISSLSPTHFQGP